VEQINRTGGYKNPLIKIDNMNYKEIKQLTNKENKKEIKKALIELAVLFLSVYASFWLGALLILNL